MTIKYALNVTDANVSKSQKSITKITEMFTALLLFLSTDRLRINLREIVDDPFLLSHANWFILSIPCAK